MIITKNLKDKLVMAKEKGYERVYVVVGSYRATTYCYYVSIDNLLSMPEGTSYHPYSKPLTPWRGTPNTRQRTKNDIIYSELFLLTQK